MLVLWGTKIKKLSLVCLDASFKCQKFLPALISNKMLMELFSTLFKEVRLNEIPYDSILNLS